MTITPERWGIIDEASIEEARELIGVSLRRERMQWNDVATRDAIRQFADGVGDDNPLWHDPEYAAQTRWGHILAPPSFLYSVDATIVAPKLPGVQWIYAGTRWKWYDVIRLDDVFDVSVVFTKMQEKTGKRFGLWVLQSGEITYRRSDGSLVCLAEGRVARTPRREKKSTKKPQPKQVTPPKETFAPEVTKKERTGMSDRRWEEVKVADSIGPVPQPLTLNRIFQWYTGAQGALHYGGAHGDAVRYRHRHDDYEINKETGAKDSAARGHFSSTEGKDVGMGGAYDVGLHRIAWVIEMLTDWMGDNGHLAEVNVDVLKPNIVGHTTYFSAEVNAKWFDQHPFIALDIEGKNQFNEVSTKGTALVVLPSERYGPVSLPLFGGDTNRWVNYPE